MTVCTITGLTAGATYSFDFYKPSPPWDAAPDVLLRTTSTAASQESGDNGNITVDLQPTSGDYYYSARLNDVVYIFHVPSSGGPYSIPDLVDTENRDLVTTGYYDLSIGDVTAVDTASALIRGDFPNQILDLGLPAGAKGDTGLAGIAVVSHGTDGTAARPTGAAVVYWVGTATPANAENYDLWYKG